MTEAGWLSEVPSPHLKNKSNSSLILVSSSGQVKGEERSRKQLVLLSRKYTERSLD